MLGQRKMDSVRFIIAVDDTDTPVQGGTGRLARGLTQALAGSCRIWGVTRHQLAVLPTIPYTRQNSANALHILDITVPLDELLDYAVTWVKRHCCAGSQPGLCLGAVEALRELPLGHAAQQRVVTWEETWQAAQTAGVELRAVAGGGDGVIGALAAASLAAEGNDGRFVQVGKIRELPERVQVADLLAAGVAELRTPEGATVLTGEVVGVKGFRPALDAGECVLFVAGGDHGQWQALRGAPVLGSQQAQAQGDSRV